MKKCILFIAVCGITFGIAAIAMSQTYFEDNFDDPKASEDKWVPLSGEWESTPKFSQLYERRCR